MTDPPYVTVRDNLRALSTSTAADDNLSMHVASILAAMDRRFDRVSGGHPYRHRVADRHAGIGLRAGEVGRAPAGLEVKGRMEGALFVVPRVLAITVSLPGYATTRTDQRLAEQAALSVELAYQAVAVGELAALHSGRLDASQRRCVAILDGRAYQAVSAARVAYDRHAPALAVDVADARVAVRDFLDRKGC